MTFRVLFRSLGRIGIGPIIVLAIILRAIPLIVHYNLRLLPQGAADTLRFEERAWVLSSGHRGPISEHLTNGGELLAFIGSVFYDFFSRHPMVLGVAMAMLGVFLVYVIYRVVFEITEDASAGRVAALAVAIFPQLILHSVLFLREMPVTLFLALGIWGAVRFLKHHSVMGLGAFILATISATLFHSGAIVAIPGMMVGMLVSRNHGRNISFTRHASSIVAVLAMVGAIIIVGQTGYGLGKFGGSFDSAMDVFESSELRATEGGAAYPEWMRIRGGFASEAWKVPIRYVALLFSPLIPFFVRSTSHLLGVLDAALYVLMIGVIIRHWNIMRDNRVLTSLLAMGLILALVYALGVANFGTAIRHRAKIAPIFIVITVSTFALAASRAARISGAGIGRGVIDGAVLPTSGSQRRTDPVR